MSIDSKTVSIGQASVLYTPFDPSYISFSFTFVNIYFRVSNVFIEPIQCIRGYFEPNYISMGLKTHTSHPSPKRLMTTLSIVTTKAFFISVSFISLCFILPPLTLHQFNGFHLFNFKVIMRCLSYVYHLSTQYLL